MDLLKTCALCNFHLQILVVLISLKSGHCLSFFTKYKRIESLDNKICQAESIMFNVMNIETIGECAILCDSRGECASISFKPHSLHCIGCDNQVFDNAVMDDLEGSQFYRKERCPDGDGFFQPEIKFRLKFYMEILSQDDARDRCEHDLSGRLVVIDKEWKLKTVSNILMSCSGYDTSDYYWTDGFYESTTTSWKFADGREIPMSQTTFWKMNAPDDSDSHCVLVSKDVDMYRYYNKHCTALNRFICEYR